ncbi:hypothetical protein [Actinocrispum sp. NPDC049592]|uniref:hypothetical protein n=1 Tax=Actinocrispum sp. NPDC049592 TaxID=3154835 RepID=UPI00342FBC16
MRDEDRLELRISDNAELLSLQRTLSLAQDVQLERVPGTPAPDSLGVADYLTAAGGGAGLLTVIKMLPDFLREAKEAGSDRAAEALERYRRRDCDRR